jgi:hypothetical protein
MRKKLLNLNKKCNSTSLCSSDWYQFKCELPLYVVNTVNTQDATSIFFFSFMGGGVEVPTLSCSTCINDDQFMTMHNY